MEKCPLWTFMLAECVYANTFEYMVQSLKIDDSKCLIALIIAWTSNLPVTKYYNLIHHPLEI